MNPERIFRESLDNLWLILRKSLENPGNSLEIIGKQYELGTKTFTDLIDQELKILESYLDYFQYLI